MQAFSRSLLELYDVAEQAGEAEFPPEVLRLLGTWVGFDGAVLGLGAPDADTGLAIVQAHVHQRDPQILVDYGRVSADDPVTSAFVAGLARPLAVDCRAFYGRHHLGALDGFSRAHGMRHLMLYGDAPTADDAGRWLVLYRSDDAPFRSGDSAYLQAAWLHVSRAIRVHRAALLERWQAERGDEAGACALVDAAGRVEAASRRFMALLRREWPGFAGGRLPADVADCLGRRVAWRGVGLEVAFEPRAPFVVCVARAVQGLPGLTPGENAVARRFAAGLSSKEIARELGVSPNTVRTQLTHLYAKLGVHDKAALAQRLAAVH